MDLPCVAASSSLVGATMNSRTSMAGGFLPLEIRVSDPDPAKEQPTAVRVATEIMATL